jgi:type I restriction enzyme, S subunit
MINWTTYKLTEVCTKIGSGATPKGGKSAYISEGISLIRSQNVLDFTFTEDGLAFINEAQAKALANVEVQERDVLVNITGDSVARICQVPVEYLPARVNQHVAILRADTSKLSPEFLKYSLLTKYNKDRLLSLASTGATRNALTKGMLEDFEISAPEDVVVQNRIAEILSALDDKIELNRRMNQTLEQMAQTLFRQYFVDGIDEDNLPEGWREGKLSEVLDLVYGKALKQGDRKGGEFPVVGSSGIVGYHNAFISEGKGIVVGRKGNAGAVIWLDKKFYPIDTTYYVVDQLQVEDLYFHYFLLKSLPLAGMNSDSAVPGLNRNDAYNIDILIPNREKIIDFNDKVRSLFDQKYLKEKEITTLTKLRDTLLPKLMSGEIDVMQMKTDEQHEPILS